MAVQQTRLEMAEGEADTVSRAIVQHVAEVADKDLTELPPLYETIDPDALDTLLDSLDEDNSSFSLEFTYAGQQISIKIDETVGCSE
ncbi:hypothetical protein EGH21_19840 [Halomicroarcula sp. F13]|uniref:Halobacterial output domain-containing protein n=2 Tax=Haloarcula rubra TaxID=2487747 RepID=A0AAW4PVQ7_9EURY|nr:hypothetical protein [Halomicroarcula rubra]